MKTYKQILEEVLNEGSYRYPGDDMTQKELKIAINAAKNILDMIDDGAMIQRWQISAIVKASEELASVCTSMRADEEDEDSDDWEDDYEDEEPMYVGFEYPSMYEAVDKDHPIVKEYDALKKHDIDTLRGMVKKHSRVIDVSGLKTKDHAITHILRAKHGNKKVDQAFGLKEEVDLDENIAGRFKNASEWESAAKSRGLVVKSMTHPSGEATKYQIAKDKQGNNRGHFDHGTKSGHLKEEADLDESYTELSNLKSRIARSEKKIKSLPDLHPEKKRLTISVQKDKKKHDELFKKQFKEDTELSEAPLLGPQGAIHRAASADQSDREYAAQRSFKNAWKSKNPGKKWPGYEKAGFKSPYDFKEETDFEVDVEGLPKMYVKANNPSEVKTNLRKVVRNPEMIKGVERVAKATLQKIFRDKASGKEEVTEEVQLDEISKNTLKSYITKKSNQIIDKDEKSDPYGMNSGGSSKERNKDFDKLNLARKKFAEETDLEEGYNDPIHRKYISDTVHDYVAKDDPKHDKIVDHLHKAKNFGSKTVDSLSDHADISIGAAKSITKEVASNLKANFGTPQKTQTQAQRVGAYLKQKHIGPRSK